VTPSPSERFRRRSAPASRPPAGRKSCCASPAWTSPATTPWLPLSR
jgi:hypothetical protein